MDMISGHLFVTTDSFKFMSFACLKNAHKRHFLPEERRITILCGLRLGLPQVKFFWDLLRQYLLEAGQPSILQGYQHIIFHHKNISQWTIKKQNQNIWAEINKS